MVPTACWAWFGQAAGEDKLGQLQPTDTVQFLPNTNGAVQRDSEDFGRCLMLSLYFRLLQSQEPHNWSIYTYSSVHQEMLCLCITVGRCNLGGQMGSQGVGAGPQLGKALSSQVLRRGCNLITSRKVSPVPYCTPVTVCREWWHTWTLECVHTTSQAVSFMHSKAPSQRQDLADLSIIPHRII